MGLSVFVAADEVCVSGLSGAQRLLQGMGCSRLFLGFGCAGLSRLSLGPGYVELSPEHWVCLALFRRGVGTGCSRLSTGYCICRGSFQRLGYFMCWVLCWVMGTPGFLHDDWVHSSQSRVFGVQDMARLDLFQGRLILFQHVIS